MKRTDRESKPVRCEKERTGSFFARNSLVVGLTGGVATGKSTVASMLAELGAKVVNADDMVHDLLKPDTNTWSAVVDEFGKGIVRPDRTIDRAALGDIVFHDEERRRRLEEIVHPPVLKALEEAAQEFRRSGNGVLVLEIPLLVETSSLHVVDKVLVVTAEQETQINRLKKRYCISNEEAASRIAAQLPMRDKLRHADWVISTEGTMCDTKKQVEVVWYHIQKLLAHPL